MSLSPKIPSFIKEIQFITYYLMNPCDAPVMLYFETARPIAGEIAVALLEFDFVQFIKNIFKPKWMRSGRHTRRGKRGNKRGGGIPELADMVSDVIDPGKDVRPNRWPLGPTMLLEITEHLDRAFWTVFLVEMVEALTFNSVIGVIESGKAHCPNMGRLLRQGEYATVSGVGPIWEPMVINEKVYEHLIGSPNPYDAQVLTGRYALVFTGDIEGIFDFAEFQAGFRINDAEGQREVLGSAFTVSEGEKVTFSVTANLYGPGYVQWGTKWTPGSNFCHATRMRLFAIQTGN